MKSCEKIIVKILMNEVVKSSAHQIEIIFFIIYQLISNTFETKFDTERVYSCNSLILFSNMCYVF
jgi:hypothetical protein